MHFLKEFYRSKFQKRIFIIKMGGEVLEDATNLQNIISDIQQIHNLGIKVIIVHGGGNQADALSKDLGHTPKKIDGRRITSQKDIDIIKKVYGGDLNIQILQIMKVLGMKGIRVSGLDGGFLEVQKRPTKQHDYGYVGDIIAVHDDIIHTLMKKNYIPVISPIACTHDGVILNINADTIAHHIAIKLNSNKLIFLTNADGVLDDKNQVVSVLQISKALEMIQKNIIKDGMKVKVDSCIDAILNGVSRVHILNGTCKHSLLNEILTSEGVGTMFVSDQEYDTYLEEKKTLNKH